eukprot:jgi/Tetstr1/427656/TSEL_017781.t1
MPICAPLIARARCSATGPNFGRATSSGTYSRPKGGDLGRRAAVVTPAPTSCRRYERPSLVAGALGLGDLQRNVPKPAHELTLEEVWQFYNRQLEERPLLTKAVVMALGLALGDILATVVTGTAVCLAKTLHMAAFGLLFQGPALHFLHRALDAHVLPARPTSAPAVACKMVVDQLVFSPISTAVFFITMEVFQGNIGCVASTLASRLAPTLLASYSIWPLALLFNYGFIPPKQRILFINVVTVIWAVVLSLLSSSTL